MRPRKAWNLGFKKLHIQAIKFMPNFEPRKVRVNIFHDLLVSCLLYKEMRLYSMYVWAHFCDKTHPLLNFMRRLKTIPASDHANFRDRSAVIQCCSLYSVDEISSSLMTDANDSLKRASLDASQSSQYWSPRNINNQEMFLSFCVHIRSQRHR
jgi:hypothetical protein